MSLIMQRILITINGNFLMNKQQPKRFYLKSNERHVEKGEEQRQRVHL